MLYMYIIHCIHINAGCSRRSVNGADRSLRRRELQMVCFERGGSSSKCFALNEGGGEFHIAFKPVPSFRDFHPLNVRS